METPSDCRAPSPALPRRARWRWLPGPDNPVTLGFVPDTHIVVLRADTIVGSYEEACAMVLAETGGVMPRTLNLVTGASRTGDIGGKIVMGAHGPRRLAIFLLGNG